MMIPSMEDSYTNIQVIPILPHRIHEAKASEKKKTLAGIPPAKLHGVHISAALFAGSHPKKTKWLFTCVCVCVCLSVCIYVSKYLSIYVSMNLCTYVCNIYIHMHTYLSEAASLDLRNPPRIIERSKSRTNIEGSACHMMLHTLLLYIASDISMILPRFRRGHWTIHRPHSESG